MIIGTHNSGTGYPLRGWQKLFSIIIKPFVKCQNLTIEEQLESGVQYFNLQINKDNGTWYISHGMTLFECKVNNTLATLHTSSILDNKQIYISLVYDKNFFIKEDAEKFNQYVKNIKSKFPNLTIVYITNEYKKNDLYINTSISLNEQYWVFSWKSPLPIPKLQSNKYIKIIDSLKKDFDNNSILVCDFYSKKINRN